MGEDASHISIRQRLALEIDRKIANNKIKEHPLKQLFWECTLRCNLHCKHCGSDCKKEAGYKDMPKEDFFRVLDDVRARVDPHKVFVIVTGGEPLMRDDLETCGRVFYEKGFPWGMVTNGLFLSEERFSKLLNAGLHTMTISLDGLEDEHNWMRGNALSYKRAINAIRMLVESGIVFDVVTCINKHNFADKSKIRDMLVNMGVKRWRIFTVFPVGRAADNNDLQLSNEEFRQLLDFIKQCRKSGQIDLSYGCEGFLGAYEGLVRNHFYRCYAGVSVASVLIDGSISACPSIRADYHQGNIYKDNMMDVWNNKFQQFRNREWMRKDQCLSCSFFRYCRGNGMHLRDEKGDLLFCHLKRLTRE